MMAWPRSARSSLEKTLDDVVATLAAGLRLAAVSITAGEETITSGTPSGDPVEIDLIHGGTAVGRLRAWGRPGEGVGRAEQKLLSDLGPQIAAAFQAQLLAAALQVSREHIVRAREEERRRLRRDLHDGIGPTLAAVALDLEAAQDLAQNRPASLGPHLDRLAARLNDEVGDIRRAVDDLRPATLDDLGLVGALRAQMERLSPPGCATSLQVEGAMDALPAAVDVAVFRIVSEALTNAVRHGSPRNCRVTVSHLGDEVEIVVADDGGGIATGAGQGVGWASMAERAAELGGRCSVDGRGGGTTVRAHLPVRPGGNQS